ncbi:DUF2987 domain-containing protein [Neptunicella marina]|uniref:DUF2987 domain-containing protein n=1 Tax=Neptunicella marina TaxID=2125989 RepID=A0A8J6IUI5_9ALTE|nr:DUF2987 domain-containing protein [Neptunicella marina]MBC3766936.1 DUF2987 domain-containing protein [Neptunicella marina]
MKLSLVGLMSLLLPFFATAETLKLEYATFYSHLRKIDDEALNKLQFAFGFKHVGENRLCQIGKALIHTQKVDLPVDVSSSQRFTLPTEKALKLARAEVQLDIVEPVNQCDMSVKIEAKTGLLKDSLSKSEIVMLMAQFDEFYSDMGSFLSFLMPKPDGLLFEFSQKQAVTVYGLSQPELKWKGEQLFVAREAIEKMKGKLSFNLPPQSITAHINQD